MRKILFSTLFSLALTTVFAQEVEMTDQEKTDVRLQNVESTLAKLSNLKISGYVQTQWQWNEAGVSEGKQNNFSVRRGRIKTAYANKYGEAVMQIDLTEGGTVTVKDVYLKLQDPRVQWVSLTAGVFDRPFGYEISYSSSRRESPERSKVFLTLFPKERDLGAKLTFKGLKGTTLGDFTLDGGLFSGNGGQSKESDSKKDFIGHLAYSKKYDRLSFGLGTSMYSGGVMLAGDQKAYKFNGNQFDEDQSLKKGDYAKREYYGIDGQFSVSSILGMTHLRAEYLWGTQAGAKNGSNSPTGAVTTDIFSRKFNGYYVYFIQDICRTKHSFVAKYDSYDPNTKVKSDKAVNDGDVASSILGLGWVYRANENIRIMAYYDIVSNEKVKNETVSSKFNGNISDDVFTLRLQYKF